MVDNFNPKSLSFPAITVSVVGLLVVYRVLRFYEVDSVAFNKYIIIAIGASLFLHILLYYIMLVFGRHWIF